MLFCGVVHVYRGGGVWGGGEVKWGGGYLKRSLPLL